MRGRLIHWLLPVALIAAAGVGGAMAATSITRSSGGTVKAAKSSMYGTLLVNASGRTLYRYTPDKKGVSVCKGACAKYWPPLVIKGNTKPTAGTGAIASLLGTTKRAGGITQVTYAGYPLYLYAADSKPGDVKGQGFEHTWYVVDSKGALIKHTIATTTTGGSTTTTGSSTTTTGGSKGGWG